MRGGEGEVDAVHEDCADDLALGRGEGGEGFCSEAAKAGEELAEAGREHGFEVETEAVRCVGVHVHG